MFKKYKEAISEFNNLLPKKSSYSESSILNKIAESYIKLRDYKKAEEYLEKNFIDEVRMIYSNDYFDAHILKEKIFYQKKDYKNALKQLNQAESYFRSNKLMFQKKEEIEELIIKEKIKILAGTHLFSIKKEKSISNNYSDIKKIINDLELKHTFNTFAKTKMNKEIHNLLRISVPRLKSRIIGIKDSIDNQQAYSALSNLTENEIIALRKIFKYIINKEKTSEQSGNTNRSYEVDKEILKSLLSVEIDCEFTLIRLAKEGFLKEETGSRYGYKGGC